ncbi:uncharacterized protein LOC123263570 isoform X2 [Cotesia glomerata]|uniref:uncharacterized protein LOC123263570 isoform X2 n=1 Tax=Cotesia glomerata TaxID=32391 RepID=UPI001D004CED|nr:uncharacterized protein LOC123263570 isoform X2 [Cotesia glomerata]
MTAEKIRRIRSNKSPRKDEDRKPWNPNLGDKRGRTFTSQRQYDIYTAYKFLEEEADHIKRCGQPLIPFPKIRWIIDHLSIHVQSRRGLRKPKSSFSAVFSSLWENYKYRSYNSRI